MPNGHQTPTLLIFLKFPQPGRVKTRLAAVVGNDVAAQLYEMWLGTVLDSLQLLRGRVRLIGFFDGADLGMFSRWRSLADDWWPQPACDLGGRLEQGFRLSFSRGSGPCLAVGSDCPELKATDVEQALQALRTHDAVFGPAQDGGYYLVGVRQDFSGFFHRIRWSSANTLADHFQRCRENNWSVSLLTMKRDIDTYEDWLAYRRGREAETP